MSNVRKKVQDLRPIDDAFFEKIIEDKEVCEEILRVILEDKKLEVLSVTPQTSVKNLQGRSVRLDAFCRLKDGSFCNIEVQKSDNDNHIKRVRYNASCITANNTKTGSDFIQVPNVKMVYISTFDVFGKGRTIYHCSTVCEETNEAVDNGLSEIYVNTSINDGTDIAELMDCFKQTSINNKKFPKLMRRVWYFKNDEGGVNTMCKVIEDYAKEREAEAVANANRNTLRQLFAGGMELNDVASMLVDIPKGMIIEVYEEVTGIKANL